MKVWKTILDFFTFKMNIGVGSPVRGLPTTPSDLTTETLYRYPASTLIPEDSRETLYVWYSPQWDEIRVATKSSGFLFKEIRGEFHLCYRLNPPFQTSAFYLIGEL
jgi:hypothetical protein